MPLDAFIQARAALRSRNLLAQEVLETRQRARLGGFFYPVAVALTFASGGPGHLLAAMVATAAFLALALLRVAVRAPASSDEAASLHGLRKIWSVVLATTIAWGIFSVWASAKLPEPAPLVALLFSGAFGMAVAHTLCMRRLPAVLAIASVMLPSLALLWRDVAPSVAGMWAVYTAYMLLVMRRSHGEYRTRLELEEDLRQQRDLFEKQSRIDGLTGLANRREFADTLACGVERAGQRAVSLLIMDIDHFKRINDSLGHHAGDACLVAVANRLRQHFASDGDLCVRLGGEEFGVVMEADGAAACVRGERFRHELERVPLPLPEGGQAAVTVSIGCGAFDPRRHADGDALYRDVDAALYRAKVGGRNRVEAVPAAAEPLQATAPAEA